MEYHKTIAVGAAVILAEARAIQSLETRIGSEFVRACELLFACSGHIVVSGVGKSGHIGGKIAATLASTGSPAFFVHPGEASHGDLGMVCDTDAIIALSNSGETQELLTIAPILRHRGIPLIALTGKPQSSLAALASVHLDTSVSSEACPHNLAPTASTAASLAMGDALAMALLDRRGFTPDDFARLHPGGALGRRLLLRVGDIMRSGDKMPCVSSDTRLGEALLEISQKGLGMTVIVTASGQALGVFTDGDLRRALDQAIDIHTTPIEQVMTKHFRKMSADDLASDAVQLMQDNKITSVLVTAGPDSLSLTGVLHMHDLLGAGVL